MIWRYPNFRKHPYIYIFLAGERQQKHKTAPWFLPGRWRFWVGAPRFTAQHGWGARPPSQSVSGFSSILKTLKALNKGYPFSHNRSGKWPSPKWKERIILEIHPFSTEPWLWEEGILSLRTNSQGHLKNGGLEEGRRKTWKLRGKLAVSFRECLVMVKRNPLNRVEPFSES